MKKIFSIVLSLALVLSLGALTVAPVAAAELELPSISPTSATFDLDDPAQLAFNIDWGTEATQIDSIEEIYGGDILDDTGPPPEYIVFDTLLVITSGYLSSEFPCVGDFDVYLVTFDVGACLITITADGTASSISPTSGEWDFYSDPADHANDVTTTVTWGCEADIDKIEELDEDGDLVELLDKGASLDWFLTYVDDDTSTLNITADWLDSRLTEIGDEVELTITFDSCYQVDPVTTEAHTAILTIEAVGAIKPSISPTTGKTEWYDREDIVFDITWDNANNITELWWWGVPNYGFEIARNTGSPYYVDIWSLDVDEATLTIHPMMWTVLESVFDPTVLPPYGFGPLGEVFFSLCLSPGALFRAVFDDPDETEIIFATDLEVDNPSITPDVNDFDVDLVGTYASTDYIYGIIDWGEANNVTDVAGTLITFDGTVHDLAVDFGGLLDPAGMWFTGYYEPLASYLFLVFSQYLENVVDDLGDVLALEVEFDKGCNVTVTYTGVGTEPRIIPTSADFNVDDDPCKNVTTTVYYGPHAGTITSIDDGTNTLIDTAEYTISGDTLTVMCSYLKTVLLEDGDRITLTIEFDQGADATFTITAVGTPLCFIATAVYGEDGAATNILREFRDKYMLTNPLGRALVDLYYTVSPPIAQFLTEHPALQPIMRAMLLPVVALSTVAVTSAPSIQIAILALLLASVAVAVWATRRRERGPAYV